MSAQTITITVADCTCKNCGAPEVHPGDADKPLFERRLLVRGFKIADENGTWWSQCLVCAGAYDADWNPTRETYDQAKGWFA